ncbi:glucose dehydrogenase [FAD, quinone]-like [Homalodisca vitripennis]|uniref:glucose dehydrogenase [FAD, quinone]-like n=1 Tax=Homalodisca vitripennis TaxID=197043 RepID=UPI001EEBBBAC|nr:glucose dehydrogenase [FAD, quinone]-like [Homalodisca vitripennis]
MTDLSVMNAKEEKRKHRGVADDCITTQNDTGAVYIRQLEEAIDAAACRLVDDVTYTDYDVTDGEEFDFIVVGAGSAGCVVANRLSENPDWRVLLLEAGGDPDVTTEFPAFSGSQFNTDLDWQFFTEPQPSNCLGTRNKSCPWSAGKMMGGGSSANALLYVRGNPFDFDRWESMGNPGWAYKHMLYYFKKSEDLRSVEVLNNPNSFKYHNRGGYLKIESFKNDITFFKQLVSSGFRELGLPNFDDVNAGNYEGHFIVQGTLDNSRRCSTAKAFIHGFQSRSNLKISKKSLVHKVLIDNNRRVTGVQFSKSGSILTVKSKKEVILSAGAINSPKLLMLSGVGPQEHLIDMGIKVIQNLNVGYNLQDHVVLRGFLISIDIALYEGDIIDSTFQFLINGKGDLTGINLFTIPGFIKTSHAAYPNIQLYFLSIPVNSTAKTKALVESAWYDEKITNSAIEINKKRSVMFITPSLLRPKSRGRILLRSLEPEDKPLIYPGYFTVEQDILDLIEGVKFVTELTKTKALKNFGARVERLDIPACNLFVFQTDPYWRCVIKHLGSSSYHQSGTCQMGPRENINAVVDPLLRVHGIKGLRVVDASIMPTITSGNTNAPTIAIAEKGADLIKQSWTRK